MTLFIIIRIYEVNRIVFVTIIICKNMIGVNFFRFKSPLQTNLKFRAIFAN